MESIPPVRLSGKKKTWMATTQFGFPEADPGGEEPGVSNSSWKVILDMRLAKHREGRRQTVSGTSKNRFLLRVTGTQSSWVHLGNCRSCLRGEGVGAFIHLPLTCHWLKLLLQHKFSGIPSLAWVLVEQSP